MQKQENHRQSYPVKKVLFGPKISLFMISLSFEKISMISKFKLKKETVHIKKTKKPYFSFLIIFLPISAL